MVTIKTAKTVTANPISLGFGREPSQEAMGKSRFILAL
jgi:hypothetical protein